MAANSLDKFKLASNGSRPSPTTLTALKSIGASSITVGALTGWPTTTGVDFCIYTIDTSGNKVAGSQTDWSGTASGTTISNLTLRAGTDNGYAVGAIVESGPVAAWADDIVSGINVEHDQDGTHGVVTATSVTSAGAVSGTAFTGTTGTFSGDVSDRGTVLSTIRDETLVDFVASGGVWSGDAYASTLAASMTALVCYINGQRGTISAVTARAFTASKDTYIDVLNTAGAFTLVYTEVANNAASPALASNSLRLGIVVTGGSNIAAATSINQGQASRTLPTTTNVGKAGIDSLGNKIYRREPTDALTFIANTALVGGGDILSITLPLLRGYDLQVKGDVSWRWTGTPAVQQNVALIIDGTTIATNRVDVWTNNMTVGNTIAGAADVAAGSRIVKLNLSGGGSQDFTAASMIIVATPR